MTPDRTAELEQAVGKLAECIVWLYEHAKMLEVGDGNVWRQKTDELIERHDEAAALARQFSQPEVKRDEG